MFSKIVCSTWAVGCQKFVQYIRMLCSGRFILVESVPMHIFLSKLFRIHLEHFFRIGNSNLELIEIPQTSANITKLSQSVDNRFTRLWNKMSAVFLLLLLLQQIVSSPILRTVLLFICFRQSGLLALVPTCI